jgi:hypothetical protein
MEEILEIRDHGFDLDDEQCRRRGVPREDVDRAAFAPDRE